MSEHIVIIHETVRESWSRDAGTFVMLLALWGVGRFFGSEALSSAGMLLGILWLIVVGARDLSNTKRMTPAQARAWLDAKFPEAPK